MPHGKQSCLRGEEREECLKQLLWSIPFQHACVCLNKTQHKLDQSKQIIEWKDGSFCMCFFFFFFFVPGFRSRVFHDFQVYYE